MYADGDACERPSSMDCMDSIDSRETQHRQAQITDCHGGHQCVCLKPHRCLCQAPKRSHVPCQQQVPTSASARNKNQPAESFRNKKWIKNKTKKIRGRDYSNCLTTIQSVKGHSCLWLMVVSCLWLYGIERAKLLFWSLNSWRRRNNPSYPIGSITKSLNVIHAFEGWLTKPFSTRMKQRYPMGKDAPNQQ